MIILPELKLLHTAAKTAAAFAGFLLHTAADFSRRLVIYFCLAAALILDRIIDRIEPKHDRT